MLKKTITYKDLDDNDVTEHFYFNLTKAELAEAEMGEKGGLAKKLQGIIDQGDPGDIIRTFKLILAMSYGVRSDDGRRFIKSPELWHEFTQTDAYSVLFMEMATNANAAVDFINGVVPADLSEQLPDQPSATQIARVQERLRPVQDVPTNIFDEADEKARETADQPEENHVLTDALLSNMSEEEKRELWERLNPNAK